MGPDLIERMAKGGIIANIQPSFVGTDARWVQARLEKSIQNTSYCWKVCMYYIYDASVVDEAHVFMKIFLLLFFD